MIFKDYDYVDENCFLDNGSNAVKIREKSYIDKKQGGKRTNKNKKKKGLIYFLIKNNMLIIISLIFVLGFTIISRDGKVYQMQNQLSKINRDISSTISDNEALEVKILKSISLDDIASIAKNRLSMIFPTKDDILNLEG